MAKYSAIIKKLPEAFEKGVASGDLLFFPSTTVKHTENEVEYEIAVCPALEKKPISPPPPFDPAKDAGVALQGSQGKLFDPFAPPYNPNLHVSDLKSDEGEEFVILLNKFSVVPQHFLLVTKEFKPQISPPLPSELLEAYLLLVAARKAGRRFFAFYNCGKNSGSSQPHKHIQFLPVEDDGPPIERLARAAVIETPERPFVLNKLPYSSHTLRLPPYFDSFPADKIEPVLASGFLRLLDLVISTIRHDPDYPAGSPSYNIILTLEHLHVIPRKHENYTFPETNQTLSVNSLGFAGMLLVKNDEELEAVKTEGVGKILRGVSVANVQDVLLKACSVP